MSGASALALDHQPESGTISLSRRVLAFFGIGRLASRSRKSLVWMLWNLSWGFVQFFATIIILFLHLKSPLNPSLSEWDACDRPLGVWAALWLFRVVLACSLCYWEYRIDLHQLCCSNGSDIENTDNSPRSAEMNNGNRMTQGQRQNSSTDPPTLPYTQLYKRLTVFSSLVTLIWFVIGNIFVYTSINTCRYAAPWLWWLNFAFLLKLYLVILETVIPTFVVLIVAPILFIFWNIFLVCIGRHPSQNPDVITPEIGKLSKSIVDRIPLVIYIPPPDDLSEEKTLFPHIYPPKPSKRQMRFRLLQKYSFRGSTSKVGTSDKESANDDENNVNHWADDWEPGQYPFITLDGDKAACAICQNDFGPPPKRKVVNIAGDRGRVSTPEASTSDSTNIESTIGEIPACEGEDAGLEPQPLRLLGCTHVFHQSCIDPWLTDISGRCPLCQKRVDSRKPHKPQRA